MVPGTIPKVLVSKSSTAIIFKLFDLNLYLVVKSFKTRLPNPLEDVPVLNVRKPISFSTKHVHLCLETGFGSPKALGRRTAQHFGGFFSSNKKNAPANRKKDFQTSSPPKI